MFIFDSAHRTTFQVGKIKAPWSKIYFSDFYLYKDVVKTGRGKEQSGHALFSDENFFSVLLGSWVNF